MAIQDRTTVICRYADVRDALVQTCALSSQRQVSDEGRPHAPTLIESDPPRHTYLRRLFRGGFQAARVESLRPHIRAASERLCTAMLERGNCDFVCDFAAPLPIAVVATGLGLPTDESSLSEYRRWIDLLHQPERDPLVRLDIENSSFIRQLEDGSASRRAGILHNPEWLLESDAPNQAEVRAFMTLVASAATETVSTLLSNALLCMWARPRVEQRLRQRSLPVSDFVEEVLRDAPPVNALPRIARQTLAISDQVIPMGSTVLVSLAAANRDPVRFQVNALAWLCASALVCGLIALPQGVMRGVVWHAASEPSSRALARLVAFAYGAFLVFTALAVIGLGSLRASFAPPNTILMILGCGLLRFKVVSALLVDFVSSVRSVSSVTAYIRMAWSTVSLFHLAVHRVWRTVTAWTVLGLIILLDAPFLQSRDAQVYENRFMVAFIVLPLVILAVNLRRRPFIAYVLVCTIVQTAAFCMLMYGSMYVLSHTPTPLDLGGGIVLSLPFSFGDPQAVHDPVAKSSDAYWSTVVAATLVSFTLPVAIINSATLQLHSARIVRLVLVCLSWLAEGVLGFFAILVGLSTVAGGSPENLVLMFLGLAILVVLPVKELSQHTSNGLLYLVPPGVPGASYVRASLREARAASLKLAARLRKP